MIWLIISVLVTLGLFVALGIHREEVETRYGYDYKFGWKRNRKQFFAVFGLLICLIGCVTKIPANSVGIIYSPFGGTKEQTLSEGFHGKNPFDKVYKISTETQTKLIKGITTQTQDAQYLTSKLDIKYKVNETNAFLIFKQYKTLDKMSESLINPTTQKVLELITTKYNIIDILGEKRSDVYSELEIALSKEFSKYGVEFVSVTIEDMDAGDKLEAAITAEAVAKKEVETAAQQLEKTKMNAQKKAVNAQAKQDAAKIEAETKLIQAKAEKEANELLQKSLTDKILIQQWIEKWNGVSPTYYGGNGADLIFNTGKLAE